MADHRIAEDDTRDSDMLDTDAPMPMHDTLRDILMHDGGIHFNGLAMNSSAAASAPEAVLERPEAHAEPAPPPARKVKQDDDDEVELIVGDTNTGSSSHEPYSTKSPRRKHGHSEKRHGHAEKRHGHAEKRHGHADKRHSQREMPKQRCSKEGTGMQREEVGGAITQKSSAPKRDRCEDAPMMSDRPGQFDDVEPGKDADKVELVFCGSASEDSWDGRPRCTEDAPDAQSADGSLHEHEIATSPTSAEDHLEELDIQAAVAIKGGSTAHGNSGQDGESADQVDILGEDLISGGSWEDLLHIASVKQQRRSQVHASSPIPEDTEDINFSLLTDGEPASPSQAMDVEPHVDLATASPGFASAGEVGDAAGHASSGSTSAALQKATDPAVQSDGMVLEQTFSYELDGKHQRGRSPTPKENQHLRAPCQTQQGKRHHSSSPSQTLRRSPCRSELAITLPSIDRQMRRASSPCGVITPPSSPSQTLRRSPCRSELAITLPSIDRQMGRALLTPGTSHAVSSPPIAASKQGGTEAAPAVESAKPTLESGASLLEMMDSAIQATEAGSKPHDLTDPIGASLAAAPDDTEAKGGHERMAVVQHASPSSVEQDASSMRMSISKQHSQGSLFLAKEDVVEAALRSRKEMTSELGRPQLAIGGDRLSDLRRSYDSHGAPTSYPPVMYSAERAGEQDEDMEHEDSSDHGLENEWDFVGSRNAMMEMAALSPTRPPYDGCPFSPVDDIVLHFISYAEFREWAFGLRVDSEKVQSFTVVDDVHPSSCSCFPRRRKDCGLAPGLDKIHSRERDLIIFFKESPFDFDDTFHHRMLRTTYLKLTGSRSCPRVGMHWQLIGFDGDDPLAELNRSCGVRADANRSCGILNVIHMFFFLTHNFDTLKQIWLLSQDHEQHFQLFLVSISVSQIVADAFIKGRFSRVCNEKARQGRETPFETTCQLYTAGLWYFYWRWRHQKRTIASLQMTQKEVKGYMINRPAKLLEEFARNLALGSSACPGGRSLPPVPPMGLRSYSTE